MNDVFGFLNSMLGCLIFVPITATAAYCIWDAVCCFRAKERLIKAFGSEDIARFNSILECEGRTIVKEALRDDYVRLGEADAVLMRVAKRMLPRDRAYVFQAIRQPTFEGRAAYILSLRDRL